MNVRLSDDEVREVRVAIRMTQASHTELVSMSPNEEVRAMLTNAVRTLHQVDRKLGAKP